MRRFVSFVIFVIFLELPCPFSRSRFVIFAVVCYFRVFVIIIFGIFVIFCEASLPWFVSFVIFAIFVIFVIFWGPFSPSLAKDCVVFFLRGFVFSLFSLYVKICYLSG